MRGDFRRRSAATWAVWGSAFVAVTLLMAWKFQWFGGDAEVVEPGSAGENGSVASTDGPAVGKGDQKSVDTEVFGAQSEPGSGDENDVAIPGRFGTSALRKKYSSASWDGPTDTPPGARDLSDNMPNRREHRYPPADNPNELRFSRGGERPSRNFRLQGGVSPAGYETPGRTEPYPNRDEPRRLASNTIRQTGYERPDRRLPENRGIVPAGNETPKSKADSRPPAMLIARIDQMIQREAILDAHKELSTIYWQKPEWRSSIISRIEKTAAIIYTSPRRHFLPPHEVQPNEYLSTIAAKYKVPYQYLERLNQVKGDRIRVGQKLKVIKGPFSVVVDLSDRELTLHHAGWFVARFTVGIGRDNRSPKGTFRVEEKFAKPQYTGQKDYRNYTIPGGHPDNPLGTHWIGIGNTFGIHGTNEPDSIGKAESKGCIRMRNADVAWVFDMLTKNSEIVIQE